MTRAEMYALSGGSRLPRTPALDGLRGAALVAVLLFHSRFSWAGGGFLGVSTFFVLSGFLITGLLLRERDVTGTIRLGGFWERRARRLAPALVVLLVVVIAYVVLATAHAPRGLVGDAIASVTWVANWRFVLAEHSYADLFTTPSPFQHMWSLAVEEQVYLLLPIAAVLLLGRRGRPKRWRLAVGLAVFAIASTAAAAMLHTRGAAPLHEYYGTDARAAEPVVGAILALVLVRSGGLAQLPTRVRVALDVAGVASLGGLVMLFSQMTQRSDALYQGGFLLTAVLSALVIAAATQPGGVVSAVFGFEPLAGLGRVSYGAYLYHWPIFLWLSPARTGLPPLRLLVLRLLVTIVSAAASYALIEAPIRAGKLPIRIGIPSWANASVGLVAVLALVAMTPSSASPNLMATGPLEAPAPPPIVAKTAAVARAAPRPDVALRGAPEAVASNPRAADRPNEMTRPPSEAEAPPAWAGTGRRPLRVAIVGDSMAANLAKGLKGWADQRGDVITYSLATLGCPLSRGGTRRSPVGDDWPVHEDCGWWADQASDRARYLTSFDPDVIVVQDAMNELPDRKLSEWNEYRHTGQPFFDQWLLNEYTTLTDTVAPGASGTKVLFLNAVCVDWSRLGGGYEYYGYDGDGDRRVQSLRATAGALAPAGVTVADFFSHLCPDGEFRQTVDGVENARPDGYHLSDEGSRAVADKWLGPLVLETAGGLSLN
ncbi:MAG TPA: acyltransferase family protein [Acidimicrobiales bacterium]|nr:acyltransferase family protein [Acidimicrobiales bacterium]